MNIYLEPIVEELEDGTIRTTLIKATPKIIVKRISNLEGFKKINFDIEKVVSMIRDIGFSNDDFAKKWLLRTKFKLTQAQAEFMVNAIKNDAASIYCNPKEWQDEIDKWKALKKIVAGNNEGNY